MTIPATDPINLWRQRVYVRLLPAIDPFARESQPYFRPLDRAYTGDNTFWATPSPDPALSERFWERLRGHLPGPGVPEAAIALARAVSQWEPAGEKLVFAAILRAGVPVADWLTRLLPGSVAVSLSLFVGLGIDTVALARLKADYPGRRIVFVDGWTGKGGVARAVRGLEQGPLAVLNDPWGWADFAGIRADIFCPTACFTGVATLGFSRTFFRGHDRLFGAYGFPSNYCQPALIRAWQAACPEPSASFPPAGENGRFFRETRLRLHTNEVCRALINAAPRTLYFSRDFGYVREHWELLQALADRREVPVEYNARFLRELRTEAACSLRIKNEE